VLAPPGAGCLHRPVRGVCTEGTDTVGGRTNIDLTNIDLTNTMFEEKIPRNLFLL
jgi:hypothetical protein